MNERKPEDILHADTTYSAVFLGSANNTDGSRDFVLRLKGDEMRALLKVIRREVNQ